MIPFLFPSTFWTVLDLYMAKYTCNLGQRSPLLIVCGGGLRTFSVLQLFPVEVNSFCTRCIACALVKAFCTQPHPSLRGANGNPTCIYVFPLGFSLVWCLVPSGCHSQGCHGYVAHLLAAPTIFSGTFPTTISIGNGFK